MDGRAVAILWVVLLGGATGTAVGAADPGTAALEYQTETDVVERVSVVSVDNTTITVEVAYEIPENVDELRFAVGLAELTVGETTRFERTGARTFEWTGNGSGGSVEISYGLRRGYSDAYQRDALVGDGWAIVDRPVIDSTLVYRGETAPGFGRDFETRTEGVAGTYLAFLGEYTGYEIRVRGESVRLIVPAAADLREEPGAVLDSLGWTARRDIGPRNEEVLAIAIPRGYEELDAPEEATGSDLRVSEAATTEGPNNSWVHEYVHTRQNASATTERTEWLVEASANYYELLANLDRNRTDFETFRQALARGSEAPYNDTVMNDPTTWRGTDANYYKGALIVAFIDYEIRKATDGEATFDDVMAAWGQAEEFDQAAFEAAVESAAGPSVRRTAAELTRTRSTPALWSYEEHTAAFGADHVREQRTATNEENERFEDTHAAFGAVGALFGVLAVGLLVRIHRGR